MRKNLARLSDSRIRETSFAELWAMRYHLPDCDVSPTYRVYLPAWSIAEGTYPELAPGDTTTFAVQAYRHRLIQSSTGKRALSSLEGNCCQVEGVVIHHGLQACVLDAGIHILLPRSEPIPALGGVAGSLWLQVALEVDRPSFVEEVPEPPPVVYQRLILAVAILTPPLEMNPTPPPKLIRDSERVPRGWMPIDRTRSSTDDSRLADYLVHCRRLSGPRMP